MDDHSEGWEAIAPRFMSSRSNIGRDIVSRWAQYLPTGGTVLDVGCGSGAVISEMLIYAGFRVFGIDASPTMISVFRQRFPQAVVACEAAQDSPFFDRAFDGAVAIGLLFLLHPTDQIRVLQRIAAVVKPGGHLLFSAPRQACEWTDMLTGRASRSLGLARYSAILKDAGMELQDCYIDAGENHYFAATRNLA